MSTEEETSFFHTLSDQLSRLTNSISTNGVVTIIDSFEGDPKAFREWTRSIEKYAVLASIPTERMKLIAYQTSKGVVSNFIRRYLDTHPTADWPTLKDELSALFAEVTDAQHAFALLRKVKQNHNENVQCFGERLLVLAAEAYSGTSSLEIERQLVGFFVDGLKENYLKLKILRENPKTLQLAVTLAMGEQNLRTQFALRTGSSYPRNEDSSSRDEPMEVDHFRPRKCRICYRHGHEAKDCRRKPNNRHVNSADSFKESRPPIKCWRDPVLPLDNILKHRRKFLGEVSYRIKSQLTGKTTKAHAEQLRLAKIDEWDIPTDEQRLRQAKYVEPLSDSSSEGSASEYSENDELPLAQLIKKYRRVRENSSSESDIPLMELAQRIRAQDNDVSDDSNVESKSSSERMRCIWLLLLPVYGITAATKVSQNVLFRPVHQVSTSRSKWLLTLVHDITPFTKFTSDLAIDIGRTLLTVDEIMTNYSVGNNSLEYENTFGKLKIEVITLRDEIEDLLDGVQDYRALSMKHARPKRALIPFVGKALSWLFGTVSTDDLNVIRSNIDTLANNQQAIQHVVAESLSILNVSRLHISENRQQVNVLSDSLRNLDIKIKNVVRQFKKKLVSSEGFLHLYLRMKLVLDDLKNMYLRAEMYASEIKLQLNMLSLGHLSPSVLTPGSLRKLLLEIQSHLPPSVRLPANPKKNLWHYYRILNCVTIIENNKIIVVLNIPLLDSDRVFEIYKIHNLPLPMTNKLILSKSKATFKMVASYRLEAEVIAVNTDRTKYAILDSDEFTKCSDPLAGFCQITSPIYPINLSQLCIVALFTENREKIRQLCKVFIKPNCILPVATYLTNGMWMVVTHRPIRFSIVCHQTSFVHQSVVIRPPIQSITLPQSCKAQNDFLELPAHFSNESSYMDSTSFPNVTAIFEKTIQDLWQPYITKFENYSLTKLPPKLEHITDIPMKELTYEIENLQKLEHEATEKWPLWKIAAISIAVITGILILFVFIKYCLVGRMGHRFLSVLRTRTAHGRGNKRSSDVELRTIPSAPNDEPTSRPGPTVPLLPNNMYPPIPRPRDDPPTPSDESSIPLPKGRMTIDYLLKLAQSRNAAKAQESTT
ncbi:hypothetical protein LOTGIDRAFT_171401 [Lottia gigantea]|uniref:CCHC-type domain-containing protein n=1 Tax=Lottia gigantea TaxID=225164 RepID=V4AHE8_LOTGI|nr:hypothetical protein LOTGIDRAFT_171401 [Lottia gigantea]ESP03464.1 hypothetical protein LOTGIDRAFT_171401 [Lottia gigantea]